MPDVPSPRGNSSVVQGTQTLQEQDFTQEKIEDNFTDEF
jgi:hypothetical protein